MPHVSARSGQLPASPIRKLAAAATAAKERGLTVYELNIGQPDIPSPKQFWDAIANFHPDTLAYSHSAGVATLREKAAEAYRAKGIEVTADQVLVTTAGSEALVMAMTAALDRHDEVIVPEPMYANYIGFAAMTEATVVPIPTHIEDHFALPPVEAFADRITDRTRAILVCNPNNPTGTVYSDAQLEALRELALKHNLFLIADEVYREFNYTGRPIKSVMQMEGLDEHAIMIDSLSKRYSLCGARVGFIVSRNPQVMDVALRFGQARLSSPTLEMMGALGALDTPQSYLDEVRVEYQARRDALSQRLRDMPGVFCPDIQGAFYATVRIPVDDADRFCQWILTDFSHEGATVQMAPASGFYATPGAGSDEVRIAYVLGLEKLHRAMDVLSAALRAYPGRTN